MQWWRESLGTFVDEVDKHRRILFALLMRELSTRYGRENIGFLWLIAEPMIFTSGVSIMWSMIRPSFENGIGIVPFVVTGYLPLILTRQVVGYTVGGVRNNAQLLYHRQISPLHLLLGRIIIETIGVTFAAVVILFIYHVAGLMPLPRDFSDVAYIYGGWFLLAWLSGGLAMTMGALAEIFDFVERFVQIITYILIPLSGAFLMAGSMPPKIRDVTLKVPFIHEFEMIRRGFFGESVVTYFNIPYAVAWAAGVSVLGLFLVQYVRGRVELVQ